MGIVTLGDGTTVIYEDSERGVRDMNTTKNTSFKEKGTCSSVVLQAREAN